MYEFEITYSDGSKRWIKAEYYEPDVKNSTYIFYQGKIRLEVIPMHDPDKNVDIVRIDRIWPEE